MPRVSIKRDSLDYKTRASITPALVVFELCLLVGGYESHSLLYAFVTVVNVNATMVGGYYD